MFRKTEKMIPASQVLTYVVGTVQDYRNKLCPTAPTRPVVFKSAREFMGLPPMPSMRTALAV